MALLSVLATAPALAQAPGATTTGAAAAQGAAPVSSAAAAQAARDSIRDLGLQHQLPPNSSDDLWNVSFPPELLWAVLVAGLLLVLYAFRDMLPIWRLWTGRGWESPSAVDQPQALAQSSADAAAAADELGRQGRFVEAMHMLLLLSLGEIRRHLGEQFADSLTSREILRGARLPAPGRTSLREIVARVEWTYFGGYPATMEDYAACRQSFDTLRGILRGERLA
ncbi:MAG TPA: DUF4129 domain-containing protein [Xanthobacteraceae bacterium]|nr:DUF4129 domain-containing protein [Xanthobacteraceae bacterium]